MPPTEIEVRKRRMARCQGMVVSLPFGKFNLRCLWSFLLEIPYQQANEHKNLNFLVEGRAGEFCGR